MGTSITESFIPCLLCTVCHTDNCDNPGLSVHDAFPSGTEPNSGSAVLCPLSVCLCLHLSLKLNPALQACHDQQAVWATDQHMDAHKSAHSRASYTLYTQKNNKWSGDDSAHSSAVSMK